MTATISHAIRINAPRDKVYEALTTTEGLKGWNTSDLEGDVAVGEDITLRYGDGEQFTWKISTLDDDATVVWDGVSGPGATDGTKVIFNLADTGDGRTAIEVDHEGWPDDHAALATCNTLWGILLGRLRSYVETSDPQPALV